jgi:hypothetical protein
MHLPKRAFVMDGKGEKAIEMAALLFEVRIALVAVNVGVELLALRSTEPSIKAELTTLTKLSNQACEALEALQRAITEGIGQ